MKKMSRFAMVAMLVLGMAGAAQAADIKATGSMQIDASSSNDLDFNKATKENDFRIEERIRTAFQFIANENLKGVLDLQIGTNSWGNGQYQISSGRTAVAGGGNSSVGGSSIMLRKAYIDFKWPDTKVNMIAGFQTVSLPAAFGGGSAILDDQVGAFVVATPITDNVKVLAGYARPYDSNTSGSQASVQGTGTGSNVVFAAVPVDFSGTNITPFAAYANAGNRSVTTTTSTSGIGASSAAGLNSPHGSLSEGVSGYWAGAAFTTKLLDPFKIMADFNYGSVNYGYNDQGRKGWLADVAVDYTGLSMMTPEAFAVYSSGDSTSTKGGRMPVLGNPQNWSVGGSVFFGDTDLISKAETNTNTGSQNGAIRNEMGFWTAGISLKDISLIDKLSHRVNVLYIRGTNDKNALVGVTSQSYATYGSYLTTKDSMWEFDLNNKYKIYDELTMSFNIGYARADLHQINGLTTRFVSDDNIYRATLSMAYTF